MERKTLKQTVMTQVYGVTQYGARAQIKGMYCCVYVCVGGCVGCVNCGAYLFKNSLILQW